MKQLTWHARWLVAAVLAAVAAALPARAQDWPSRPVTVVYPWPPGGGTDTMMRMVADRLSRQLGQQFIIDVRAGASGTIGSEIAAKARPDGYTLVMSGLPSHVVAPAYSGAPFDSMKDFSHIALLGGSPVVLAVHPEFGAKTLQQYIDLSRSKPDGIAFGSPGTGSFVHLAGERFRQLTGAKLLHVPYKGLPPVAVDLIAGHIPSAFMTLAGGGTGALHRAGKVRLLAIATPGRVSGFSEVPTFAEGGYKDLVASTWFALSGPAGLPRAIVARLNAEVRAALAQPEIYNRLLADGIGIEPRDLDPDGFTRFFQAEIERWAPLAREAKTGASK
jgi:tripartite-type tricarboxylate transporter receptor subunit TctC